MQYQKTLFALILIAFLGCSKPAEKSSDKQMTAASSGADVQTCPEFYYFYNREKVVLQLYPERVLVGFVQGQTPENMQKLLSQFPEFAEAGPEQRSAAGIFIVVKLKPGTTCVQALAFIKKLQQNPGISFANPAFKPPHNLGNTYDWVGITTEFMVTLKAIEDMPVFEEGLTKTKTNIIDPLGETTFLVQATKSSRGNALEMANYFHEQPYILNAEPDFFLANPQNGR